MKVCPTEREKKKNFSQNEFFLRGRANGSRPRGSACQRASRSLQSLLDSRCQEVWAKGPPEAHRALWMANNEQKQPTGPWESSEDGLDSRARAEASTCQAEPPHSSRIAWKATAITKTSLPGLQTALMLPNNRKQKSPHQDGGSSSKQKENESTFWSRQSKQHLSQAPCLGTISLSQLRSSTYPPALLYLFKTPPCCFIGHLPVRKTKTKNAPIKIFCLSSLHVHVSYLGHRLCAEILKTNGSMHNQDLHNNSKLDVEVVVSNITLNKKKKII